MLELIRGLMAGKNRQASSIVELKHRCRTASTSLPGLHPFSKP